MRACVCVFVCVSLYVYVYVCVCVTAAMATQSSATLLLQDRVRGKCVCLHVCPCVRVCESVRVHVRVLVSTFESVCLCTQRYLRDTPRDFLYINSLKHNLRIANCELRSFCPFPFHVVTFFLLFASRSFLVFWKFFGFLLVLNVCQVQGGEDS